MASPIFSKSNEETISGNKIHMPAFEEIVHELRESTVSVAQTSNTTLTTEDSLINEFILLPQVSQGDETIGETCSAEKQSDTIVDALNSFSKRISIEFNSSASTPAGESEGEFTSTTPIEQKSVQRNDNIQPSTAVSSIQPTAIVDAPKKKQHIMISYNRSCEDTCRKIRNNLKDLKYKVWMDVYDMRDNFIGGMAKAIRNSYIVLMCINRQYDDSYWCKKEAEDIAIKRIKFIPCFMEEPPIPLEDWLDFLVGGNVWVDFSKEEKYNTSFDRLIEEITAAEKKLAIYPRETPPTTPSNIMLSNPVPATLDDIMRNFKTWVEDNRQNLKRLNRNQSTELINQLIHGLQSDNNTPDDEKKKELLQQLLLSTSREPSDVVPRLIDSLTTPDPMVKGLLFIVALWAVRVIFKKN